MNVEHLVTMANDIAAFFASDPATAASATASHLRRFWDPRMRREMIAHHAAGGAGLGDIARAGVKLLAEEAKATAQRA
jgi:formate dehydrogenase subunit delta